MKWEWDFMYKFLMKVHWKKCHWDKSVLYIIFNIESAIFHIKIIINAFELVNL